MPVWAQLRTADRDAAEGTVGALEPIVADIRQRCPKAQIILRGDSGFCREESMRWCEEHDVGLHAPRFAGPSSGPQPGRKSN